MPSRPANLTVADTAAEQGNTAATVTGVAADSVELAIGPANPTAAVPLAEQGNAAATVTGAAIDSAQSASAPANPTAAVPLAEQGNASATVTGAAIDSAQSASAAASAVIATVTERGVAPENPDIHAELDDDEQPEDTTLGPGLMQSYLRAVQDRLKKEVANSIDPTLMSLIKENDWWLHSSNALQICNLLGLTFSEKSYYRDIYVWLPEVRWGEEGMPSCPHCRSNSNVAPHCWRENHAGRRICNLDEHYFAISRRYICHTCKATAARAKQAAALAVEAYGMNVLEETATDVENSPSYTSMAWDMRIRSLFPFGYGDEFPAFLTHRGGVDYRLVDLMRPLFNKGVRSSVANLDALPVYLI